LSRTRERHRRARRLLALGTVLTEMLLSGLHAALAPDPNLRISQYAHTPWRVRYGTFAGAPSAITIPALERLTGLNSEKIKQADWRSFLQEEDRAAPTASWQRSLANGTPYCAQVRMRGSDGDPECVELVDSVFTIDVPES
jgi:hypothetical protein